jgi:hypothetical protein
MNYNIISITLIAVGFSLLFFIDNLIDKDNTNNMLQTIRDNNLVIGLVCLGAGYYVYTLGQKQPTIQPSEVDTSEPLENILPSYEEATSTDEILRI